MIRVCIVEREFIEEALQCIESVYPDATWMEGQKPSEWIPGVDDYVSGSVKYFTLVYNNSGSETIYYRGCVTMDNCMDYIGGKFTIDYGYLFEQLCYVPLEFDNIDGIYIGEDILI